MVGQPLPFLPRETQDAGPKTRVLEAAERDNVEAPIMDAKVARPEPPAMGVVNHAGTSPRPSFLKACHRYEITTAIRIQKPQ